MKNQIPIYIISLSRTPERRLHIQRQLDASGLEYSFVDVDDIDKYELESKTYRDRIAKSLGIDKSVLEDKYNAVLDSVKTRYKKEEYEKYKNDNLGQIAIILSHIKVYDLMIKNDIDTACILEDDATLLPTFPEVLQTAAKLEWDILMLASQPTYLPLNLIQQRHIKHIRIFNKDLLFVSPKKRDYRIKCILEEYGFNPHLYTKQSETVAKVVQEYDTRYSEIIKTLVLNNRYLSWVKPEHYMKYSALRGALKLYALIKFNVFPKKSSTNYVMYGILYKILTMYAYIQLGALPKKSSLNLITDHHCIAEPKYKPLSTTAYLVKQSIAMKWKRNVLAKTYLAIDSVPWKLYKDEQVKLRLITPPCATATYNYLRYSVRREYIL